LSSGIDFFLWFSVPHLRLACSRLKNPQAKKSNPGHQPGFFILPTFQAGFKEKS
jgi:hypothetical protein